MSKQRFVGIAVALLTATTFVSVHAQEVATLALRNGERPSGELLDLNASGFTLRINGQDRQYPQQDVAAVEFVVGALPDNVQQRANDGTPFILLTNGQIVEGRLVDIGGTRPLKLTVDTPSGQREFMSNEVAQVRLRSLDRSANVVTQEAQAEGTSVAVAAGGISVPAAQAWTDTGITVARGTRVQFVASGNVMISPAASSGPGGSPAVTVPGRPYPVPDAPAGALVGRIGSDKPFLIGVNTQPIRMETGGRLSLGVNDDQYGDNSGFYLVGVTRIGR